jgi:hypothetical protein
VSCAPASWLAAAGEVERMSRGSDIVVVVGVRREVSVVGWMGWLGIDIGGGVGSE